MTKEQLQNALNEATARIDEQKAKIAELEAENGKITAELAEAKKQIKATAGANAILEDELNAARAQQPANRPEDKAAIAILLGAIAKSCFDHCPHHLDEEACRNCGINKSVFNAGFKLPKPAPAQEA